MCVYYVCACVCAPSPHSISPLSPQDSTGTKEDILAALVLDPDNEECLPLIARVFPGKSKTDLLQSHDAEAVADRLTSLIQSKAPQEEEEGGRETIPASGSKGLLSYDMELELAAEDDPPTRPVNHAMEGEEEGEEEEDGGPRRVVLEEEGDCDRESETPPGVTSKALSPRQWLVLDRPLPSVGDTGAAVMPPLRACMQESEFHAIIYYSKKNVGQLLYNILTIY